MGIKSLKKILKKKCNKGIYKTNISQFAHKTIFIDTSIFMYRYKYVGDMFSKFLFMIHILLKYNITPVFVFDGKPTDNKINNELEKRKIQKEKVKIRISNLESSIETKKEVLKNQQQRPLSQFKEIQEDEVKLTKLKKQTIKITYKDFEHLKQLLTSIGIKYLQAPYETDVIIPYLVRNFGLDAFCLSGDTDFLPHRINLLANFDIYTGNLDYFNYEEIKTELGMSDKEFVDMCILMGCDYCEDLKGIGPMKSFDIIKKYTNLETYFDKIKKQNTQQYIDARNMFISPVIKYEFENNLTVGEVNKDDFKSICDKLELNARAVKNIGSRTPIKKNSEYNNPITNYFSKKN